MVSLIIILVFISVIKKIQINTSLSLLRTSVFQLGVYSVMIPMYVGEIAEPQLRGQLGAVFQMAVITGDLHISPEILLC